MMEEIEILDLEKTENHQAYYQQLIEIIKEPTKANSLVIDFEFTISSCQSKITKYEIDGSNQVLLTKTFSNNKEVLTQIIEPFIQVFASKNNIVINSLSPGKENTTTLKIISEKNDMCNITGLDDETATKLLDLVDNIKRKAPIVNNQQKIDEKGVGNVFDFLISLLVVGLILLSMLVPNFVK